MRGTVYGSLRFSLPPPHQNAGSQPVPGDATPQRGLHAVVQPSAQPGWASGSRAVQGDPCGEGEPSFGVGPVRCAESCSGEASPNCSGLPLDEFQGDVRPERRARVTVNWILSQFGPDRARVERSGETFGIALLHHQCHCETCHRGGGSKVKICSHHTTPWTPAHNKARSTQAQSSSPPYRQRKPASTGMIAPVIPEAAGEARKATVLATSESLVTRPKANFASHAR